MGGGYVVSRNFYLSDPFSQRICHVKVFLEGEKNQEKRINKRWEIIREKELHKGCVLLYKKRNIKRTLKKISKDGFLVMEDSNSRESPEDWDLVV